MTFEDYKKIHCDDTPEKMVEQLLTESDVIATCLSTRFTAIDSYTFDYWDREYKSHKERQKWLAKQLSDRVKPRALTIEEAVKAPYVWLESKDGTLHDMYRIRQVPIDSTAIMVYKLFNGNGVSFSIDYFDERFRCWSDKPTKEQQVEARQVM